MRNNVFYCITNESVDRDIVCKRQNVTTKLGILNTLRPVLWRDLK